MEPFPEHDSGVPHSSGHLAGELGTEDRQPRRHLGTAFSFEDGRHEPSNIGDDPRADRWRALG
jgi:hypothetical protein